MRTRAASLAAVVAFALAVATVAVLAGRGNGDQDLIKLPLGASSTFGAGDAAASTTESRSALLAPGFAGVEYRVSGTLPDLPSTAPAYRLGSTATAEDVRRLGQALGLDGDVTEEGGRTWVLTDGDRQLRVERAPGLPWYMSTICPEPVARGEVAPDVALSSSCEGVAVAGFAGSGSVAAEPVCEEGAECAVTVSRPAPAPAPPVLNVAPPVAVAQPTMAGCTDGTTCTEPAPSDVPPTTAVPHPAPEVPRPADLPSREDAQRIAKALFERLGAGTEGFKMEDGWATWEAWVEPRLDGLRVFGPGHSVSIGPKGELMRASGSLARAERIGDYPLVGLEKGLERLKNPAALGRGTLAVDDAVAVDVAPMPTTTAAAAGGGSAGSAGISAEEAARLEAAKLEAVGREVGSIEPAPPVCADPTVPCQPVPPVDLPLAEPPVPAEPVVQTIVGAHLALMQIDAVLVPVYVFELEGDGETFPVPAVTDEWLEQQAPSVGTKEN